MIAVSSLRNPNNEREGEMEDKEFPDLSGTNLLDSIDFDDLFLGDVLPDLEILGEFSLSDESEVKVPSLSVEDEDFRDEHLITAASSSPIQEDDTKHESVVPCSNQLPSAGRKSAPSFKNPPGKRKVKVDWTPELHRRFVQAVEQLGVDKAVPSRILELMGIDCLTRHNIASHLQKYRSHRKHLLTREAEAASWSQRRQMYGGSVGKRECGWNTMGFPPVTHFRPLHVWGHPSLDHIWPKPLWSPPPHDPPSFWIPPHHHHVPTPCYPPPHLYPARFPGPAVAGIPPGGIYKVEHPGVGFPTVPSSGQTLPQPPSDIHPSKESVDAAIGDVLSKPWLPLPLGLKPPSTDGVMVELQRQGISKVPPSCVA